MEALHCRSGARPWMDPNEQPLVPLSAFEWQILVCVYDLGSANPIEVSEQLMRRKLRASKPKACGGLLARLAEKGYVAVEPERKPGRGRPPHSYTPLVPRQTVLRWQFQEFVEAHLLTDEELELLPSFLERRVLALV